MAPARPPFEPPAPGDPPWRNLYLLTDRGRLDCRGEVLGIGGWSEALAEGREVELPGGPVRVPTLDALIRSKEALRLPKDRAMLVQLRAIRERRSGET